MIGNVPFADVKLDYKGQRLSLHDYFFAKSVDALKPGGILGLVTSHFTLDKQNAAVREYLAERADFVGAIRLPSDAFKQEGTRVVTDIVFLKKRARASRPSMPTRPGWKPQPVDIEGADIPINRYFLNHPEMVLGTYSRQDRLYDAGYSVKSSGDLAAQLATAIRRLPESPGVLQSSPGAPRPRPCSATSHSIPPSRRRHPRRISPKAASSSAPTAPSAR